MDTRLLQQIVAVFDASAAAFMELETKDIKIKLKKPEGTAPVSVVAAPQHTESPEPQTTAPAVSDEYVKSPLVGTFYRAPAADRPPFVQVGRYVNRGDTLCIIEAMKVMNEIKAPKAGWITDIKAADGQAVAFDDELMAIGEKP